MLKAATGIEITHLDVCSLFKKEWESLLTDSSKMTYPAGLDPQPKDVLSAFSIFDPKKVPSLSTHEIPLYMESVQFKLSLDSLGEKAAIVSSAQSGKRIVSSY